jgi:amidase
MGHLRPPTVDDLRRAAAYDGLELGPEADAYAGFAAGLLRLLDEVESLPELEVPVRYPRDPGRRPTVDEDPVNAFIRICEIRGAGSGPLAGKRVAVKDNIAVAGVPLTNGSRTLSYTPAVDAVVVERILDAGGTIVGKTNLDDFSGSGFGVTSVFGPPRNPLRPTHSAGGSSGGSAAAVAAGLADLALGADSGGSVRMPAAQCGVVGLKATHGLVPSFGVTHIDHTLDSIGPIARTVAECALLLSVIAGEDWRDPQWVRGVHLDDYAAAAADGVAGLRVGMIAESLDEGVCTPEVLAGVEAAAEALRAAGATVEQVSIPLWRSAFAIWFGVLAGGWPPMLRSNGIGYGHLGYVDVERSHAAGLVRRHELDQLPPTIKLPLLLNRYLDERYQGVPLARALNQRIALRRAVDDALTRVDVLLSPTVPHTARQLPEERLTEVEALERMVSETVCAAPTNVTGHPSLAVPSGLDGDGLPTSAQVIGRHWQDRVVLAAGAAVEQGLALG